MNTSSLSKLRWVDLVRVIGAFLVVMAHVSYRGGEAGLASSFYYVISRVAVPLFFMVSGYLLLGREEPYDVFFKKRALKVAVPFVIWSVIYLLWNKEGFDAGLSVKLVLSYILKTVHGPRENHLWFFYHLIGLYFFTPILRVFVARASLTDLFYFCGLWFLVVPIFSFLEAFTPVKVGIEVYFIAGYVGYFMLGYLLGKFEFSRRQLYWLMVLVLILSIGTTLLNNLVKPDYFVSYLSVNIVLLTVFAYILLREVRVSDQLNRFLIPISRASFGVYLVHVIVLAWLEKIPVLRDWFSAGSAVYMIPLLGLIGFTVSYVIVAVIQKIPVLRWSVP